MRKIFLLILLAGIQACVTGCGPGSLKSGKSGGSYSVDTRIEEVMAYPGFGNYGRLIFPVDRGYYGGDTLGDLSLTWYNNIDRDKTVEIVKNGIQCRGGFLLWISWGFLRNFMPMKGCATGSVWGREPRRKDG